MAGWDYEQARVLAAFTASVGAFRENAVVFDGEEMVRKTAKNPGDTLVAWRI